jgi:hypothetical protein
MKFVVLNNGREMRPLATFYERPDYNGAEQSLAMGRYALEQFSISGVSSVKLKENVALITYENPDKTGRFAVLNGEVPDLGAVLAFKPSVFSLTRCVSGFKDGKLTDYLVPGVYDSKTLQRFDSFKIPEEARMTFWSGNDNEPDEKRTSSYEATEVNVDEKVKGYDRFAVVVVGNKELADQAKHASELSDEELLAVAGGCKAEACSAEACAADSCQAQACGGQACAVNVIPVLPIGP